MLGNKTNPFKNKINVLENRRKLGDTREIGHYTENDIKREGLLESPVEKSEISLFVMLSAILIALVQCAFDSSDTSLGEFFHKYKNYIYITIGSIIAIASLILISKIIYSCAKAKKKKDQGYVVSEHSPFLNKEDSSAAESKSDVLNDYKEDLGVVKEKVKEEKTKISAIVSTGIFFLISAAIQYIYEQKNDQSSYVWQLMRQNAKYVLIAIAVLFIVLFIYKISVHSYEQKNRKFVITAESMKHVKIEQKQDASGDEVELQEMFEGEQIKYEIINVKALKNLLGELSSMIEENNVCQATITRAFADQVSVTKALVDLIKGGYIAYTEEGKKPELVRKRDYDMMVKENEGVHQNISSAHDSAGEKGHNDYARVVVGLEEGNDAVDAPNHPRRTVFISRAELERFTVDLTVNKTA